MAVWVLPPRRLHNGLLNPDSAVGLTTCIGRGVSLEQRTHRTVMFQSHFSHLALRVQRLRTPLITPMLATWLEAQAHCVRCGRLAPRLLLRLQLRNPVEYVIVSYHFCRISLYGATADQPIVVSLRNDRKVFGPHRRWRPTCGDSPVDQKSDTRDDQRRLNEQDE